MGDIMYSDDVIKRLKEKVPLLTGDDRNYGFLQLDIVREDKTKKQLGK